MFVANIVSAQKLGMKKMSQISSFNIGTNMKKMMKTLFVLLCLAASFSTFALSKSFFKDHYPDQLRQQTVYTMSNDASQNEVLAFRQTSRGFLEPAGRFATGGTGTGTGLGNQSAIALSANGRYLFAVNPGSNDVSVFRIQRKGLKLIDRVQEDGLTPVSISVSHNLVYVVNTGDDSIFGYRFIPRTGKLKPLGDSYRKLSSDGTAPAQISFNRAGDQLVVTEKATNIISIFVLNEFNLPESHFTLDSAGETPFGFAFGKHDQFFVSEAQGGAVDGASVSSYQLFDDGTATLINGAVAVGQTAACWLATTPDGKIAFTANTPAGSLSAFSIDRSGNMTLLDERAAEESGPRDIAISDDGKTLYTVNGGDNSIGIYRIYNGGKLRKLQSINNLPDAFTGLVVR